MLRIALLAAVAVIALPSAAEAAVLPSVAGDTLTVTGDGAADHDHSAPHRARDPAGRHRHRDLQLQPRDVHEDRDPLGRRRRHGPHRGRADRGDDDRDRRGRRHRARRARRRADLGRRRRRPGRTRAAATTPSCSARATTRRSRATASTPSTARAARTGCSPPARPTPRSSRCRRFDGKARLARDTRPSTTDTDGRRDARRQRRRRPGPDRRRRPGAVRRARPSRPTSACWTAPATNRRPGHRPVRQHRRAAVQRGRARRGPGPSDPDPERAPERGPADRVRPRRPDFISAASAPARASG